jgi:hypothetical protein
MGKLIMMATKLFEEDVKVFCSHALILNMLNRVTFQLTCDLVMFHLVEILHCGIFHPSASWYVKKFGYFVCESWVTSRGQGGRI